MNSSIYNPGSRATAMPTGSQSRMPRRSSYAAVVSGTASSSTSHQQQPGFPQWTHDMLWAADDDTGDFTTDSQSTWRPFAEHRQLPPYSRAFQGLIDSRGPGGRCIENINSFFIPSYLRASKYAKKLEDTRRAKAAAKKSHSRESSSASSADVDNPRKAPSYNGVTLEIVEKAPPRNPDEPEPLPSRMNAHDKHKDVEVLADGLEIKFIQCSDGKRPGGLDGTAYSIRADAAVPQESGMYYFELTVLTKNSDEDSAISIGLAIKDMQTNKPVGWEKGSYGYHGDDGCTFRFGAHNKHYGPEFGYKGDTIGCGINFTDGTIWFTKNGADQGTAFRDVKDLKLFPTIGLKRKGEHVRVNFGQRPFIYDIDGRYKAEKAKVAEQIEATKTDKLAPPLDETSLIQSLVLQYLSHDGYVDTAQAFAEEVQAEREALTIDPKEPTRSFEFTQNHSASNRQQIRNSILEGDIETALRMTRECFPKVLEGNRRIYFHIRLRQFIEMIKRDAEANNGKGKETNGDADDWLSETMQQEMELDPPANSEYSETDSYDRMETDEANGKTESNGIETASGANGTTVDAVDAIQFGKQVKREFQLDADKEMRKQLGDAFALLSYEDPAEVEDVNWMLKQEKRVEMADELNSAILVSLGKAPAAALDRVVQQTTVLIDMLARQKTTSSPGTLINVDDYLKPEAPPRSFNL